MGRKQCAVLTAALCAVGLVVTPAGAVQPGPSAATGDLGTVTLITGDQVRVSGDRVASVRMAGTRRHVRYWQYQLNGHDYVVPDDAVKLLAQNKLDKRLFDVTGLVQQGYDDAHEPNVPTIVTGGDVSRLARNMQAVDIPKREAAKTWGQQGSRVAGEQKVWLNGRVRATLDQSTRQIGAPQAWQQGLRADGVKVAVLDTGYDGGHPDLKSKVDSAVDFTGEGPDDPDVDQVGHGTHVASTIAGTGAASDGRYKGVAPGARLLVGKVLGEYGGREDWIINGMRWAVDSGAKVVNMSLGGSPSDGTDLMSQVVNELSESSGALFVIAAGNSGVPESVGSPGSADRALTVANVTKSDQLSVSSSEGPRTGDFGLKPEIAAPGTDIVAARAEGTLTAASVNEYYARISGTSMATPHVAGAAAILAGQHPEWTGEQIKNTLIGSSKRLPDINTFQQGAGRLDVARSVNQQVRVDGLLGFGRIWGQQDADRKITYANDGTRPVELALSLDGVPADVFGVDKKVTVPAKSAATIRVTAHATAKPLGSFNGILRAQSGDVVLNTPLTADLKGDKNTLTIKTPAREGDLYASLVLVQNEQTGYSEALITETGEATFEVPTGTYRAIGRIIDASFTRQTLFAQPVQVSGNTELTVDTKQGKPVTVGIDDPDARPGYGGGIGVLSDVDEGGPALGSSVLISPGVPEGLFSVGGPRMRGISLVTATYWTPPLAVINVEGAGGFEFGAGATYAPFDLDFQGKVTARVVDVGEADTESINKAGDLTGAIVLITAKDWANPVYPPAEQLVSGIELIRSKGARAVVSYFNPTSDGTTPVWNTIMAFNAEELQRVQELMRQRPVELTLTVRPNSPTAYFVSDMTSGVVPTGHEFRFHRDSLARIDRQIRDTLPAGVYRYQPATFSTGTLVAGADVETKFPQQRTDYVSGGSSLSVYSAAGFWDNGDFGAEITIPETLKAGDRRTSTMFQAPFGPELTTPPTSNQDGKPTPWVHRLGDQLTVSVPMFADSNPGNASAFDQTNIGSTVLLKDGKEIGRRDDRPGLGMFNVPRGPGRFTLIADANRPQSSTMVPPLSTKTRAEWTFNSGPGTAERAALPLLDIRFTLPLDDHNTFTAGKPLSGKVDAAHQPGSRASRIREVNVEFSLDEGKTWQRASVHGDRLEIPGAPAGFVSLRASAKDTDGNSVTETVIRAYATK